MSKDHQDYSDGYDKGFAEGLKSADFSDAYWLRYFAAAAMQGLLASVDNNFERYAGEGAPKIIADASVRYAQALLAEVKRAESEENND